MRVVSDKELSLSITSRSQTGMFIFFAGFLFLQVTVRAISKGLLTGSASGRSTLLYSTWMRVFSRTLVGVFWTAKAIFKMKRAYVILTSRRSFSLSRC